MYGKYEIWYRRMSSGLRDKKYLKPLLKRLNRLVTCVFYVLYPLLLAWLFLKKNDRLVPCIVVPAVCFIFVTVIRKGIGRRRPFAACDIDPLIQKENKNDSMPSRHVFSAVIITMVTGYFFPAAGVFLFILCLLLAMIRVIAGIHYPSDVLVGMLLGILGGLLFYAVV